MRGEAEQLRSGTGVGLGEPGVERRPGRAGGARPATSGRPGRNRGGKGEKREREQREKDGIDSKFEFFSKISVET